MNGLSLRINQSNKNTRNYVKFRNLFLSPSEDDADEVKKIKESINICPNIEEQLKVIRELLLSTCNNVDAAQCLVSVFLQADPKHPVKLFLARHITENTPIQPSFTRLLIHNVKHLIVKKRTLFADFIEVVNKVASVIENSPAGVSAMKSIDVEVIGYFKDSLQSCLQILRSNSVLSPTNKNDIFNLAHLTFRLLLNFISKLEPGKVSKLRPVLDDIKLSIEYFIVDADVPMDTKSVCGIVYLTIYLLQNGSKSWSDILAPTCHLAALLENDGVQISLYAAIFTIVPIEDLQTETVSGEPAVVVLTDRILAVGERSSSESTFVLCVARSVLQISKLLDQIRDPKVGLHIIQHLLLFIWGHLEHHMDSVRHLTPQALGFISKYCSKLKQQGNPAALQKLVASLSSLDACCKVYYVIVKLLVSELGAEQLMQRVPRLLDHLLDAAGNQAVHAAATSALEVLIHRHAAENGGRVNFDVILSPILKRISKEALTSIELDVLEGLIMTAFKLDPNIDNLKPYLECNSSQFNIKCGLVLLAVIRKCVAGDVWRGYLNHDVIKMAATHTDHETRILSLSFMVTSPKSIEVFQQTDLDFVLYFLKYNINAQSPNFRQLVLSLFKKFIKRFEDSYKAIRRQPNSPSNKVHYYLSHVEQLRSLCFESLLPGANYSRRVVSLQLLVWIEEMDIGEYTRNWNTEFVERLLYHLDDSYESNKANALEVLGHCPTHILRLKMYSTSLDLESIIAEANSTKPTDCVSAAYKLALLIRKLPENITSNVDSPTHEVCYVLLQKLLEVFKQSVNCCESSISMASQRSPMYGVVRCMRRCLGELDIIALCTDSGWVELVAECVRASVCACAAVRRVVCHLSPEGMLPAGAPCDVEVKTGKVVTAQMVLLCAWRTVKEVSLLLGELSSFIIKCGGEETSSRLVSVVDDHFTTLLTETKHRGAFEQAYVGYTMFLTKMWRARDPAVSSSLQDRLWSLLHHIQSDTQLSATRRSAGIPFMIQALVTTEMSASGSSQLFSRVMSSLLQLASSSPSVETRTHSINILRALYRCTHLQDAVSSEVGAGLLVAMEGFSSCSWMERNASTLLFSALLSRVFGVSRARNDLSIRNKMTGRIFFLRYPHLYDYMLSKLQQASSTTEKESELRPALYAALLLLSRLYPSALEGATSHLQLSSFLGPVSSCSGSGIVGTRRLAARALLPLLPPHKYFEHVASVLMLLGDKHIKRNHCHGLLLQLTTLLEGKPEGVSIESDLNQRFPVVLLDTMWILEQALSTTPCYLIADEYIRMINLILWKYPDIIHKQMVDDIASCLQRLLYENKTLPEMATSGMEVCLTNATYLQIVLTLRRDHDMNALLHEALEHSLYDVKLPAMNYLLLQHRQLDTETCLFLQHLYTYTPNTSFLSTIDPQLFMKTYSNTKHLECQVKCLMLLTLQKNNQENIVSMKSKRHIDTTRDLNVVIDTLIESIESEHEDITHIYLKNLMDLTDRDNVDPKTYSIVLRIAFECSCSENSEETRKVVVSFLEEKLATLFKLHLNCEDEVIRFESKATLLATIVTLLEDDDTSIRDRAANIATLYISLGQQTFDNLIGSDNLADKLNNFRSAVNENVYYQKEKYSTIEESAVEINSKFKGGHVLPSKAGELLREFVAEGEVFESVATLLAVALMDFKSEVRLSDDVTDECRVFDQSERYNIHLEETIWTCSCADLITAKCRNTADKCIEDIITNEKYRHVICKLCNENFTLFERLFAGREIENSDVVNPKIQLFVNKIRK